MQAIHEQLLLLHQKAKDVGSSLLTEGATKTALIMPFIQNVLGYDVFNPSEVIPEFTADAGVKKAEKVDYALAHLGTIQVLIECKKFGENLNDTHLNQLFRYFSVTKARLAILTNGMDYRFYTDIESPNLMDKDPFLSFSLRRFRADILPELQKLAKLNYDPAQLSTQASELKYISKAAELLKQQLSFPTDDFVRLFASSMYTGVITPKVRSQFHDIMVKASTWLQDDLRTIHVAAHLAAVEQSKQKVSDINPKIVTTEEEISAFNIVKAILCERVPHDRIVGRDTQSYFGVLLDDNNRKPIVRLYFNGKQKYVGVFGQGKVETKIPLRDVYDLYTYKSKIMESLLYSDEPTQNSTSHLVTAATTLQVDIKPASLPEIQHDAGSQKNVEPQVKPLWPS